uniref:DNA polymerase I n=1 Tax=Alistipes sp. TaxID=1872444 RepID=UPI004057C8E8
MSRQEKLFLVDAYALIYKYYYAFMGRPMRNHRGMNTSVIFGFVKFLRDILKREKPDLLGVAFDPKGGCFRRELYPEYKANRPETPEDILLSVPYIKEILKAMCIPILEVPGFEADDVIGSLAHKGVEAGLEVYMVTPDKDYGQLVRDHCHIYKQRGDQIEVVDRAAVCAKYGIEDPILVRDILAIWGDASDNIPGVPGIGEKGACRLVQQWGEVENMLRHASELKGKQGESIRAWGEKLLLSKELTSIRLDVPIEFSREELKICDRPHVDRLQELFAELGFKAFLSDLNNLAAPDPIPDGPRQEAQQQLAEVARAKSSALKAARLEGQGDLFAAFATGEQPLPTPPVKPESVAPMEPESYATIASTPHRYITIEEEGALAALVQELISCPEIAFDTETTGLDPFAHRLVGLSLAAKPHEAYYIPFPLEQEHRRAYVELLRPLFMEERIDKIGQNIKFDLLVLRRLGLEVRGRKIDTMILHYLLDPEARHNMNVLAERYLGYTPIEIESLIGRGAKQLKMDQVAVARVAEYAAEDADITLQLKEVLFPLVEKQGLQQLYFSMEEPLIGVLADMEWQGVKIDTGLLGRYAETLNLKLSSLETEIRSIAGDPELNINSSRQLGELLFAKMRISEKPKMTKTKQFSTDEEYLQSFAHKYRIVDLVLEYRGVKKLLSTYVEALPLLVNPSTDRIHTSFNQAVTATGRLSSANPNLQNIPIRDELGKPIREAFIPSDEEHELLSVDYSQVELRLMAHLSEDEGLISAFAQGEDIHAATAAKIFGKGIEEVSSDERRRAKTANFGIIYGISAFGLAQRLEIPRGEAKALIEGYFSSYPKVKAYMERVVVEAREKGYVETIFSRRRYLNDISSQNAVARGLAERNAINAPIQGSAADIMKLAMVAVARRFRAEGIQSRMILQVHDELVIDTLRSERDTVRRIVVEEMEAAANLRVKLIAEAGFGENWLEAH